MSTFPQKLIAEFLGTFAFVFFSAGAICTDAYLVSTGQSGLGTLGIALASGLAFGAMVSALAHISGGHFNPAISIGFWVTRRLSTLHTITYWIAQLSGATAAAYAIKLILPDSPWARESAGVDRTRPGRRFHPRPRHRARSADDLLPRAGLFRRKRGRRASSARIAGLTSGFVVAASVLFGGPFTGAALNPARALGPALAITHWQNHGVYWAGPLLGGVIAGFLYDRIFLRDQPPTS